MVKLNRTRHFITISIVCIAYLFSACDSKQNADEAHYNLGVKLIRKGNTNEAIAEFRKAIQLYSSYTEAHLKYIDLMERQGKKTEILDDA